MREYLHQDYRELSKMTMPSRILWMMVSSLACLVYPTRDFLNYMMLCMTFPPKHNRVSCVIMCQWNVHILETRPHLIIKVPIWQVLTNVTRTQKLKLCAHSRLNTLRVQRSIVTAWAYHLKYILNTTHNNLASVRPPNAIDCENFQGSLTVPLWPCYIFHCQQKFYVSLSSWMVNPCVVSHVCLPISLFIIYLWIPHSNS